MVCDEEQTGTAWSSCWISPWFLWYCIRTFEAVKTKSSTSSWKEERLNAGYFLWKENLFKISSQTILPVELNWYLYEVVSSIVSSDEEFLLRTLKWYQLPRDSKMPLQQRVLHLDRTALQHRILFQNNFAELGKAALHSSLQLVKWFANKIPSLKMLRTYSNFLEPRYFLSQ